MKITNSCFESYKNLYYGKNVFLLFPGPSLKLYLEHSSKKNEVFKDVIKVGCNSISLLDQLTIDYYFVGDPEIGGGDKSPPEANSFKLNPSPYVLSNNVTKQKFCRKSIFDFLGHCPEGFQVYLTERYENKKCQYYPLDISKEPINQVGSISMDMMQFVLFCGFKNIFLIGQDCNYKQKGENSHINFHNYKGYADGNRILRSWNWMKSHTDKNYKDTNIFIVNPVSLNFWPSLTIEELEKFIYEKQ
jgi:hypothetical protein